MKKGFHWELHRFGDLRETELEQKRKKRSIVAIIDIIVTAICAVVAILAGTFKFFLADFGFERECDAVMVGAILLGAVFVADAIKNLRKNIVKQENKSIMLAKIESDEETDIIILLEQNDGDWEIVKKEVRIMLLGSKTQTQTIAQKFSLEDNYFRIKTASDLSDDIFRYTSVRIIEDELRKKISFLKK